MGLWAAGGKLLVGKAEGSFGGRGLLQRLGRRAAGKAAGWSQIPKGKGRSARRGLRVGLELSLREGAEVRH